MKHFAAILILLSASVLLFAGCDDSNFCSDACDRVFDCEDELVEQMGQEGFNDYFGESKSECSEYCSEELNELDQSCQDCLDESGCADYIQCIGNNC